MDEMTSRRIDPRTLLEVARFTRRRAELSDTPQMSVSLGHPGSDGARLAIRRALDQLSRDLEAAAAVAEYLSERRNVR